VPPDGMATWNQADIDRLRAAYIALLAGEAVQTVRFDGPPGRTVTYHPADIGRLEAFLRRFDAASTERNVLISTRKGL
jgi:hypothetical protein